MNLIEILLALKGKEALKDFKEVEEYLRTKFGAKITADFLDMNLTMLASKINIRDIIDLHFLSQ